MEFGNQYLSYAEYIELGGTLDETPFNILEVQARKNIDKYTTGKLKSLSEQIIEVKTCMFQLVERLSTYQESNSKIGYSESTDGYSISYAGATENLEKAKQNEIKDIIKSSLSECYLENGTPYLYVGV